MQTLAIVSVFAACLGVPAFGQQQSFSPDNLAPYIPTPQSLVEKMLEAANVRPSDVVYDLGSGDGRIVITAAQKFGAKAVGVELSENLCESSRRRIKTMGLDEKVTIVQGNILNTDLSPASVVTLYLLTSSNERLRPLFEKYLKPGARVVSNDYPIRGWRESRLLMVRAGSAEHRIYVYEVGRTN
jgi:precorrin-6B methylase 2